ncbi:MAG TPA: hypothetical protein VIY51_29490 [Xanthobacteraceae bacterium]
MNYAFAGLADPWQASNRTLVNVLGRAHEAAAGMLNIWFPQTFNCRAVS